MEEEGSSGGFGFGLLLLLSFEGAVGRSSGAIASPQLHYRWNGEIRTGVRRQRRGTSDDCKERLQAWGLPVAVVLSAVLLPWSSMRFRTVLRSPYGQSRTFEYV